MDILLSLGPKQREGLVEILRLRRRELSVSLLVQKSIIWLLLNIRKPSLQ